MYELCQEHQNKIERICLHPECHSRALCLLCDHPHGAAFRSIMAKQSQSYRKFQTAIDQAIDRYLLQRQESEEEQMRAEQIRLTKTYFSDIRTLLQGFIDEAERDVLQRLSASQQENFQVLRKARVQRNYVRVPQGLFRMLLQIYQGTDLKEIFRNCESGSAEEAYKVMGDFHVLIINLMESRRYRHRLKLPDIRTVAFQQPQNHKRNETWTNYDAQDAPKKMVARMQKQSTCEFDSIITDCIAAEKLLLTASYDKKLRIFDRSLGVRGELQYPNVLTRIQPLGEDVYAVGLSREIMIENIRVQQEGVVREHIMKLSGHTQRIADMNSLNTRILASSSTEGVKVWDLYHERCEYTLREESSPTAIRFIPTNISLAVGYANHTLKIYSTESMRVSKKYSLKGVSTIIDQGKCPENTFYVGSFPNNLSIFDLRMASVAVEYSLPSDAPTCLIDSINDQSVVAVGDRGGNVSLLDLRTRKVRVSWEAHPPKTHLSRPRGVVGVFEEGDDGWITVGCNDRKLKLWEVSKTD